MDDSLRDLLHRFREGDEAAFDALAEGVGRMVHSRALKALGDPQSADDITQEVLLRVYRRSEQIGDLQAFEAWIFRVTFNLIHDHFRRRARERQVQQSFGALREQMRAGRMSDAGREELAEVLRQALEALDEKHREVFILKEVEGLSHEQISQRLGIPEGTVWSRLSYARKRLRERLTLNSPDLNPG